MATKRKQTFDITAFVKGVERPSRDVELCMDREKRERIDALIGAISVMPIDDEPLAGDPARDAMLAEIAQLRDDATAWTKFGIVAPSNATATAYQIALAGDGDESTVGRILAAKATLIAECLVSVDGNPVEMSTDDAIVMLTKWPNDLTEELVNAMFLLGGGMVTLPLSQRLSAILTTPEPADS